jgi:hypothetical protein
MCARPSSASLAFLDERLEWQPPDEPNQPGGPAEVPGPQPEQPGSPPYEVPGEPPEVPEPQPPET